MEIFTVGHSNHSFADFLKLLQDNKITMLIDVRSSPKSRWPQFGRDALMKAVRANGIKYLFGGTHLGGMTNETIDAAPFVEKMDRILSLTEAGERVAIMCSEGTPCDCHRAGKLTAYLHRARTHVKTTHIMRDGSLVDARKYEPQVKKSVWWHQMDQLETPQFNCIKV